MTVPTMYIIVAILIVANVIAWLVFRSKSGLGRNTDEALAETQRLQLELDNATKRHDESEKELATLKERIKEQEETLEKSLRQKEESLKSHYEQLLADIQVENDKLDSALKASQCGNMDESISIQLSRVEDLQKKLESLRSEHQTLINESSPLKGHIARLEKKIEDLEEEVDEANDNLAEEKKKFKRKAEELEDAIINLDKSRQLTKHLEEDLRSKEDEIEHNLSLLQLKTGSIEFIQAILSAPQIDGKDVSALYKSIDFLESFVRGPFMDCNSYLFDKYPVLKFNGRNGPDGFNQKKQWYLNTFEEWASVKRKSWLDGKTTIAFVGEFSAGKTSIVNRILSQDDPKIPLLPVSTKATTAIPTYIAGGVSNATYRFVSPDNKVKIIDEKIFKKVSKEILDEIQGVSSLIKYFVMTYDNPHLSGLSILDTPGFSSNDKEDKLRTVEVINECDVLFWVVDVNNGNVNGASIARIKADLRKPIIVVINKVDTKSDKEVDDMESKVRETFDTEGVKIQDVIRFSAKAPLADIMNPIKSLRRETTRESIITSLDDNLKQLSSVFEKRVREADQKYNSKYNITGRITDKFSAAMRDMWNACNEAANIPQWKEHIFSSNRFEMNEFEGNRLKNLLYEIGSTKANNLARIYNEEIDAVSESQQAYSELMDVKSTWIKIEECISEFKKVSKPFR